MTNADDELSAQDRALMQALAEAIGAPRPPTDLVARSQGLLAWLDVDAELAELLDQPVAETAGTRGSAPPATTLEFVVGDGTCVIELTPSPEALRGQLLGGDADTVVARATDGTTRSAPIDALGAFRIDAPPSGTTRLEFDLTDGRRIHTDWFVV